MTVSSIAGLAARAADVKGTVLRNGRAGITIAAMAVLVAACEVGPDFKSPEAPVADRYSAPNEAQVGEIDAGPSGARQRIALGERVKGDWWRLFQSPDLDTVVKDAIAGSPTLEAAKARLSQAQEVVVAAAGRFYPQVDAGAGVTREKLSAAEFGLRPSAFRIPSNFNLYQFGATASYDADVFGGTRRAVERAAALADAQRHQLSAAYVSLTGDTIAQAVQIASVRAQTKAVEDILAVDRKTLSLVSDRRSVGAVPQTDVVSADSQLASDETLVAPLEQQLSVARHALAVLLGRVPANWAAPDFDLASLTLPGDLPVSVPSELVHQRPDILVAEADLHAASAQIGIATAALYPSVNLSGSIGREALSPGQLFNPASFVWSIAAGVTQPVFHGFTLEADRRAALAAFKASAADYQNTVLRAFGQVADVLQALAHDGQQLAAQKHALDTASESVRLQQLSYSGGYTNILNVLDAQRHYEEARLGYVRAEAQRYQDTIQLLVALGGGWWEADLAAPP